MFFVLSDELGEGDRCLCPNESTAQSVEPFGPAAGNIRRIPANVSQRLIKPVPGSRSRHYRTGLDSGHIRSKVSRVLANEVHQDTVTSVLRPGDPVLVGRFEVDRPEAAEKSWVHVVDIVFSAMIDSSKDTGLRVENHGIAVSIVA